LRHTKSMQTLAEARYHRGLSRGIGNRSYHPDNQLHQQLLPFIRRCIEAVFENDFEESTHAVTRYVCNFAWPGEGGQVDITSYMPPAYSELVLMGRILEVLCHWIRSKAKELDSMVYSVHTATSPFMGHQAGQVRDRLTECGQRLQQASYLSDQAAMELVSEFVFSVVSELLGRDASCLASVLGGMIFNEHDARSFTMLVENPTAMLATLVRILEELQSKVSKIVMEFYEQSAFANYMDSKNMLMCFFQYYTVETTTGVLEVHESATDAAFAASPFRVHLVDSFGCLMKLLSHLEFICYGGGTNGHEVALAVDFEGMKLCRHGALCLVQMTISDDPTLVYVLDVHLLGKRCFSMQTANGTSMKGVLESEDIRKVWFDPRNDVDALWHQFGIMPRAIFDLQLAEVADRRNRGLNVHYVQGLYKCLTQCPALQSEQKVFAERINILGKNLFEPANGGQYEVFQQRPLNPVILVYAAHDSRYMLVLYEQFKDSIGREWEKRVLQAADQRARWCMSQIYQMPSSEAPDF